MVPLLLVFIIGIGTALGSLLIELIISIVYPSAFSPLFVNGWDTLTAKELLRLLLPLAVIEEIVKFLGVLKSWQISINKKSILYLSPFVGFGFASVEITFNYLKYHNILLYPFLGIVIIHSLTSLIAGLYLINKQETTFFSSLVVVISNIWLHLAYNLFVALY